MIKEIHFTNFKVLRDTTLPLGRFTLMVGPNGSGKSTALEALKVARVFSKVKFNQIARIGSEGDVVLKITWSEALASNCTEIRWRRGKNPAAAQHTLDGTKAVPFPVELQSWLSKIRIYDLHPSVIANPVGLQPKIELGPNGAGLAGVLDRLRDEHPERFEALNFELNRWIPEFDRILFSVPKNGQRSFELRTIDGKKMPSADLSDGTLLALTMLTLAYLPGPPPLIAFEDPDRGIHPRLLREVRDALYRLAYPEDFSEQRDPVQVIATTHSPYFLDLFRDHPEEIVIAQKTDSEAKFERLSDREDIEEILQEAALGEVWYSGVLGGVPAEP